METLHGKLIDIKDVLDKKAQSHMRQAEKNRSSEKWCNYHLGAAYGYNAAKDELEQLIRHHNWEQETHNSNLTEKDVEELELKNLHKFKVGDWIVFNGLTLYIKEIVKGYYRTISKGGITNSYDWEIDNLARLWSIEEAEIGDILTASDGSIFVYAGLKGALAQSYIALLADGDLNTMKCNWEEKTSIAPTTEEQRSLLFRKMKEAGYVWDDDKNELRKIKKINE